MKLHLLLLLLLIVASTQAQQYDTASIFSHPIELDSFVVRSGFDVQAFIRRVKNDTTFYKAVKTMRLMPWTGVADFVAYKKDRSEEASLHLETRQMITPRKCRKNVVVKKTEKGRFFEKGKPAYYTAELFFNMMFAEREVCYENDIVAGSMQYTGNSRMEKNKFELKQLLFNPGSKVQGIPFMGDKAAIFDEDEIDKYDLKVTSTSFAGQDCYQFSIHPKPEYRNKVVFNELTTWFTQAGYKIVARNYSLSYSTLFYKFDVAMKVTTTSVAGKLVPAHIEYDGSWHVFTKSAERMKIVMDITY